MSFEYMDEFINIYKVLTKDECEEINKYLEKNPKISLRLLWFSNAKDLNFLENIPNTKALSIEYSSIENIDVLEKLPKLSILSLEENENKIDIEVVKKLTNLTSLNLNFKTKLRQTDLSVISNLKNLKEFYFSGKFKKNSLNLNHIPNLEIFSPLMSAVNIEQLGVLTKLKYLKLSNQKIETLEYLEKLISIKKVFLNNIKIENQDVLVDLFNLPQLEILGISYVKNIIDFQFTKDSSSIRELILWSLNDLRTYKGIERLSALKKLSHCGNHKNPNTIDFNNIKLLKSLEKLKIKVGAISNLKKKELKNIFDELKMKKIQAIYCDEYGEEETIIYSDGLSLKMMLRGVLFEGNSFDDFEVVEKSSEVSHKFLFKNEMLLFSKLEVKIPITVQKHGKERIAWLHGVIEQESLDLRLELEDKTILSKDKKEWFEENMLSIEKQLDENEQMKCCLNCQYADYFYAGSGMFGSMFCFRNIKEKYLNVSTKEEYMKIFDEYEMQMQETHLCSEFEQRIEGTGYRG